MGFKKITFQEGLFAVIVISFVLIAMTFSVPFYNENYTISFEFQFYSFSTFILFTSILVLGVMFYFNINTFHELFVVLNLKSSLEALIIVNLNILFFVIAFFIDEIMQHKNWYFDMELALVLLFVSFLVANFVAIFSVNFITYSSPKFFGFGKLTLQNAFGILYYLFWIILFFVLCLVLISEGYPLLSVSMLIFGLIKANLLSHCSY